MVGVLATEKRPQATAAAAWLLLIHQLPAKPAYFRVKIWRRLQALGAVLIRNAVYALPANEQTREDFDWVLKEIAEGGGEALICEARLVAGLSDEDIRAQFNAARDADYAAVANDARELADSLSKDSVASLTEGKTKLARMKSEMARLEAIDFFGANGREASDGLLAELERRLTEEPSVPRSAREGDPHFGVADLRGRVWVTRQGVHVDRIASAWLIRRFIDPRARFKFVPGKRYRPQADEIRFDMFEAEFTHEGDRCTFEVLLERTGVADPGLTAIAEIVHDIDLKEQKFGREETPGIAHLIAGISIANNDDEARLERGGAVFNDLYEFHRRKRK